MSLTPDESLKIIQKACGVIEDNGSISGFGNMDLFDTCTKLLYIDLDRKRYKGVIEKIGQEKLISIIKETIIKLKKDLNNPRMRSVYNQEIDNQISLLNEIGFEFVFFVNITLPEDWDFGKINIDGYDVEWVSYNEFKKSRLYFHDFDARTIKLFDTIYKLSVTAQELQKYSLVSFHVSGYDNNFCENKASEIYEKLLGLINLAKYYKSSHWRFGLSQIYSFSELTGMNILYLYKEETFIQEMALLQYSVCKPFELEENRIKLLRIFQERIRVFDYRYDLLDDLYSFLSLYQSAMKAPNIDNRFLYFWETIELFLRKKNDENYSVIIERAKCLFNHDWMMKRYLEYLKNQRNNMVHTGTSQLDLDDIDTVKAVSESIFAYYLFYDLRFELRPYLFDLFDLMNNDRANLQEMSGMIDKILSDRTCRD